MSLFTVKFVSFNGMNNPLQEGLPLDEARAYAKRYRERALYQYNEEVTWISPWEWEIQKEDAHMVSDRDGYLKIVKEKARPCLK